MIFPPQRSVLPDRLASRDPSRLCWVPPSYGAEGGYGSPGHFAAAESGLPAANTI